MGNYLFTSARAFDALTLHNTWCKRASCLYSLTKASSIAARDGFHLSHFQPIHQAKSGGKHNARIPPKGTHLPGREKKETQHYTKGPSNFSREEVPSEMNFIVLPKIKVRLLNQTHQTLPALPSPSSQLSAQQ
jgi:hypothetical protein